MKCKSCRNEIPDNSVFCLFCGEKQVREKKKRRKEEIKVPKPVQLPSGAWRIQLKAEKQSVTESTPELCITKAKAIRAGFVQQKAKSPRLSLHDATTRYIDSRRDTVSPGTIKTYLQKQRLYFSALMQKDIHEITTEMIQAEIRKMRTAGGEKGKPLSAKTVKDVYGFFSSALKYNGVPVDESKISLQAPAVPRFRILTDEEIAALLQAIKGDECELPILLALWLGLRRSEIIALEREDFDFDHKTVRIHSALVLDENGDFVEKAPKTPFSARLISCPEIILRKVWKRSKGRLFAHSANLILRHLKACCKKAGIPQIRLHDLRHINASAGLKLGIPDKYMMERGGWSTKDTMVYRYEHTVSEEKAKADAAMNDYFQGLLGDDTEDG